MADYNLSPVFIDAQLDSQGAPLDGGKLSWYLAGTTTPATTYQTNDGLAPHTNPIILNARGEPPSPVWLQQGVAYKCVLLDAVDVPIRTIDDIIGIGDTTATTSTFGAITVDSTGNAAKIFQDGAGNLAIATNQGSGAVNNTSFSSTKSAFGKPVTAPKLRIGDATVPTLPAEIVGSAFISGNVRIGSNVAPTEALDVTGNAKVSGNATVSGTAAVTGRATLGDLRLSDTSWGAISVPSTHMIPAGTASDAARNTATGYLYFSGTVPSYCPSGFFMPPDWKLGTAIIIKLHLLFFNAGTGASVWQLSYNLGADAADFANAAGSYTVASNIVVTNPNNDKRHVSALFGAITMTGLGLGSAVMIQIGRIANDVGDTDNLSQMLLGYEVLYERDSIGSDTATSKT